MAIKIVCYFGLLGQLFSTFWCLGEKKLSKGLTICIYVFIYIIAVLTQQGVMMNTQGEMSRTYLDKDLCEISELFDKFKSCEDKGYRAFLHGEIGKRLSRWQMDFTNHFGRLNNGEYDE